jgi:beta-lactamase superfamily II metal-dependent hydrolase
MQILEGKMSNKNKRIKLTPISVIVILLIGAVLYMVSLYIDMVNDPPEDSSSISTSEVTVSHGELGKVEYHFIDVGQGDATLIRTPEGDILIDAGENSAEEDLKNYPISTNKFCQFFFHKV